MLGGRRTLLTALVAASSAIGCGRTPSAPACDALGRVARQAAACDAALGPLADALEQQPDELACRVAARRVLTGPRDEPPRVRSVWTIDPLPDTSPLTPEEIASLADATWPAELIVVPDIAPAPGVPTTSAHLEDGSLESDGEGRLHGHVPPGASTLRLRHAGRESSYCVELRSCETLRVTAHGDKLARHPDVTAGSCRTQ
jgi:hypothetical protein